MIGGKCIFCMMFVYYYFEFGGLFGKGNFWSEWKVDFFFWGVGFLVSFLILVILYLM